MSYLVSQSRYHYLRPYRLPKHRYQLVQDVYLLNDEAVVIIAEPTTIASGELFAGDETPRGSANFLMQLWLEYLMNINRLFLWLEKI